MDKKYKYNEIPSYTNRAGYQITIEWAYVEQAIEGYIKDYGLNLDPDFQRAHVWDDYKQAKYVEYCLRGGQSGKDLYFNCIGWNSIPGEYVVVDGKQRLEAVRKFMRNELQIFCDGTILKNKKPLKFEDFNDRPRLIKSNFTWHINDLKDRKAVLQWYLDLNEGGVVHTDAELDKVKRLLKLEK